MTLTDLEWPFYVKFCFVKFKFKICLFTYTDSAMMFMDTSTRAGSLCHRCFIMYLWFVSFSQVNVFDRTQAYYLSVQYN